MQDAFVLIPIAARRRVCDQSFLGRRISRSAVGAIACASVGFSFIFSLLALFDLRQLPPAARSVEKIFFSWIVSGEFQAKMGFLIDPLSIWMMLVVTGVSFLIHVYSVSYMRKDPDFTRYFTYLNLFVFFNAHLGCGRQFPTRFLSWAGRVWDSVLIF